ncbi:FAD-dependent oxidoreductase, partial [Anaerospora sp.]|uniref:FAD-dependent oxidoreductase n=1 Tax=Anaerospora sp. TaxID=1960278 RepID=UPI0037C14ECA
MHYCCWKKWIVKNLPPVGAKSGCCCEEGKGDIMQIYDVVIIGAGPAGLSAGLYAGRSRLNTLLIEKEKDGGQIVITSEVEN